MNEYLSTEDNLDQLAHENEVDIELIHQLLNYEQSRAHLKTRRGARDDLRKMIEDWMEAQE